MPIPTELVNGVSRDGANGDKHENKMNRKNVVILPVPDTGYFLSFSYSVEHLLSVQLLYI